MISSKNAPIQASKKEGIRAAAISAFWKFSANRELLLETERLIQIQVGLPAHLFRAVRIVFELQDSDLEKLLGASIPALDRRFRRQKALDPEVSERLDRIAIVCLLAEGVFLSREIAVCWMSKPNKALGGCKPIMLCETEIGGNQIRRVLQALEWGGPV